MFNFFIKILFIGLLFFNTTSLFSGLLPDTIILTGSSELKKVEDLEVGDGILIYSIRRHEVNAVLAPIKKIRTKKSKKLVLIDTNTGYLKVGLDQKLYNRKHLKFVKAKKFKVGDKLFSPEVGELFVTDVYIHEVEDKVELYDITIDGENIFFILNSRGDPVLAHNIDPVSTACILGLTAEAVATEFLGLSLFAGGVALGNYITTGSTGIGEAATSVGKFFAAPYKFLNKKVIRKTPISRSHRRKKRERKRARRNNNSQPPQKEPEENNDTPPIPPRNENEEVSLRKIINPDPRTPVGRRGQKWNSLVEFDSTTIGERKYSGHAVDRINQRGFTPTAVENTIRNGVKNVGNTPGTFQHVDTINNIKVITNTNGDVVTIHNI